MPVFRPKEVFQKAQEAESQGKSKEAAVHYGLLSAYLRRRGKHDEAMILIQRATKLAPGLVRLTLHLALCAEAKGDKTQAEKALSAFADKVMQSDKVEKYLAVVESTLKESPRLRQIFFDRLLELDRTNATSFLGRARSLAEQGEPDKALKVLVEALQTGMQETQILEKMEALLRASGMTDELGYLNRYRDGKIAMEGFVVLLSKKPRVPTAPEPTAEKPLRDLIEELEKEIGIDLHKPQREIEPLLNEFRRRSAPILGQDAKARMDMSLAFFEMGLLREAQEELEFIPETDPLFGQAQVFQGEICLQSGSLLAAMDAFQKCLRSSQKTAQVEWEARYKLTEVFFRLGDLRRALDEAAALEKQTADYRDLRLLKRKIQEAIETQTGGVGGMGAL